MRIEQLLVRPHAPLPHGRLDNADLVLCFGSGPHFASDAYSRCRALYPRSLVVGCSTAGDIFDTQVLDDTLSVTAVSFEDTTVRIATSSLVDPLGAGKSLAEQLRGEDLTHVIVLSDGVRMNGTALTRGLVEHLPRAVAVTGGLAGDGERMTATWVVANGPARQEAVVAVGFYGRRLKVGYGSMGGWDAFGPDREITRAEGNTLYELDGRPALELYRDYLGEYAEGLPSTGLLFPLSVRMASGEALVRTILGIDEKSGSLRFAGDIPMGAYARLMKANVERLIDGAQDAARAAQSRGPQTAQLALLISCVGRRMILRQRVEEETEAVRSVLGPNVPLTGFYSNGELCPSGAQPCALHNQTMTITTLSET